MKAAWMSRIVLVAVFSAVAFPLLAQSRLVGVTGDGASVPSSLYFLDQADASSTFIMTLGAGNDGETIGYNPVDNLLYHASGYSTGFHAWDSIDVDAATVVMAGTRTGDQPNSEFLSMAYDPASGTFLTAGLFNDFQSTTLGGVSTQLGLTPTAMKGLAFAGGTLYGVSRSGGNLFTLDPLTGTNMGSIPVTLDGGSISGMNGLATDPDTGVLWGVFRQGTGRFLGTLDPSTGAGTSVGALGDKYAGIAFVAPLNQPPVAADDFYGVSQTGTLDEAAPGVLVNDTDPDGDPLSMVLVSGPSQAAAFQWNADGSFSYTPLVYFSGTDSFTYVANDGAEDSNVATVEITVTQPGAGGFITGGGRLAPSGGKRTFGLVAKELGNGVQGSLEFQDHAADLNVKSDAVDWVYAPDQTEGFFSGTCTVNGVAGHTFFVEVHDGGGDDITVWVFDALGAVVYSSGDALSGGNIKIH